MAIVKISNLPNAAALDGTEKVPLVQSNATVKTTAQAIGDLALKNLRIDTWGYPGDNPVRLTNKVDGESILIQSTDGDNNGRTSLRWHIRPEPSGPDSVYSQVDAQNDGIWIKNADWSGGPGSYAHYWHFTNEGSIVFPTLTTPLKSGTANSQTLRFGDPSDQVIITGPEATAAYPTSQRLIIQGSTGYTGTTGEGGDIYLWAGKGGNGGGSGGDIKIDAGVGMDTGQGGTIKIRSGNSENGTGGFLELNSGYGLSTGDITISAPFGGSYSGVIGINAYNNITLRSKDSGGSDVSRIELQPSGIITTLCSYYGITMDSEEWLSLDPLNSVKFGNSSYGQLIIDNAAKTTLIGDIAGGNNNSYFGVDDNNVTLVASNPLVVNGSNGPSSGLGLQIKVNGVDYLIDLLTIV